MSSSSKPNENPMRKRPPATMPEARENQLIALAYDLVEKRLREGTASSQETTHFLKIGSTTARAEKEILFKQKDLITAKTEQLQSAKRIEELYKDAMRAFTTYSGGGKQEEEEDD